MRVFFSRKVPFGLLPDYEVTDHISFDAYPVNVDPKAVLMAAELRALLKNADALYENMPAPEEAAQEEARFFEAALLSIAEGMQWEG